MDLENKSLVCSPDFHFVYFLHNIVFINTIGSDQSDETNCTNVDTIWESDTSINRCPQEDWTVQAVAAIYLLFSNLLLVNLVIAMFR